MFYCIFIKRDLAVWKIKLKNSSGSSYLASLFIFFLLVVFIGLQESCSKKSSPTAPTPGIQERLYFTYMENDTAKIGTVRIDGSDFKCIVNFGVLWSKPSSGYMTFYRWDDTREWGSIFVSQTDGTNIKEITNTDSLKGASPLFPVISPDAKYISFYATDRYLYLSNIEDGITTLISSEAEWENIPSFSPDSKFIAFYANNNRLIVTDINGNNKNAISDHSFSYADGYSHLEWSADGEKIVFIGKNNDGHTDVFIVNADGSNEINLTNDLWEDIWPSFCPDGDHIIYSSLKSDTCDIRIMGLDGSNNHVLTNTPTECKYRTAWSSSGENLAFITPYPHKEGLGTLKVFNIKNKSIKAVRDSVWSCFFAE